MIGNQKSQSSPSKISGYSLVAALFFGQNASALTLNLKLDLVPIPNPPEAGENKFDVLIKDDKGEAIEKADVRIMISMLAMGAMPRMEEKTKIVEKGGGRYLAEYDLSMGGTWDVVVSVAKEGSEEKFNFSLTTGIPGLVSKGGGKSAANGDEHAATNILPIGPDRLQRIGVRFAEVKTMLLNKTLRTAGIVESDNTRKTDVTLRFSGYVEKQFRGRIGDTVQAGTPLVSVYSPDLIAAQSEFLLAHGEGIAGPLHTSTSERLKNMGLSQRDIERIEKTGKPQRDTVITAPQGGTVLDVTVREGSSFSQGQILYSIGDLTKNYIVARVFQRDVANLIVGQPVEIITPDQDRAFVGKVDLIFPSINEGEGTANVRVQIGEGADLKPGTFVDLRFPIDLGNRLVVPVTAILYSGSHKYVFVDQGEGALEPREIKTGKTTDDFVEVMDGVNDGERVASAGTFLISSEAQLRSALPKWKKSESLDATKANEPAKTK